MRKLSDAELADIKGGTCGFYGTCDLVRLGVGCSSCYSGNYSGGGGGGGTTYPGS
jgi:hypothetical protein